MNRSPDLGAALDRLPHGPDFRFVDRLLELEGGVRGAAEYTLRGDEPFLRGHFPGMPLMPGVLLIEAGAQLAGVVAQSDPAQPVLHGLKLAAVRQARIHGSLLPGQTVRLEAELLARMGGLVQARVRASLGARILMEAEVALGGSPVALA
jgi:3-hydroxyacyl-[acyl-carrier-protein] dehydratase